MDRGRWINPGEHRWLAWGIGGRWINPGEYRWLAWGIARGTITVLVMYLLLKLTTTADLVPGIVPVMCSIVYAFGCVIALGYISVLERRLKHVAKNTETYGEHKEEG
jgi:hypothetical protein